MQHQALIDPPRRGYLNTALTGLPGQAAADAARQVLDAWTSGTLNWTTAVDQLAAARTAFAALVGAPVDRIGVGHSVAATLSAIAANLPDHAVVLVPDGEHNSNIYPYLHQAPRGVRLEFAPLDRLADAVRPHHAAIAFGLVQSADGRIADLPSISAAARQVDALTLVDVTQACGWLRFDPSLCDVFVSASYKWLMSPNGPAFLGLGPRALDRFQAAHRSWIGNIDVHAAPYGPGGEMAPDARRFDVVARLEGGGAGDHRASLADWIDAAIDDVVDLGGVQAVAITERFQHLSAEPDGRHLVQCAVLLAAAARGADVIVDVSFGHGGASRADGLCAGNSRDSGSGGLDDEAEPSSENQ